MNFTTDRTHSHLHGQFPRRLLQRFVTGQGTGGHGRLCIRRICTSSPCGLRSNRALSALAGLNHGQFPRGLLQRFVTGQGTGGNGMGLRPEDSNLTTRLPKKSDCFFPEKYPSRFTTDRLISLTRTRGNPFARHVPTRRQLFKLGESATAVCRFQRRKRSLHHPALYFVSFVLRASRN